MALGGGQSQLCSRGSPLRLGTPISSAPGSPRIAIPWVQRRAADHRYPDTKGTVEDTFFLSCPGPHPGPLLAFLWERAEVSQSSQAADFLPGQAWERPLGALPPQTCQLPSFFLRSLNPYLVSLLLAGLPGAALAGPMMSPEGNVNN